MSRAGHEIITSPDLPAPVGYAHAVVAAPGRTVHLGGQTAQDLVSLQVYVTDLAAYRTSMRELGGVWRSHFGRRYPAIAVLGVTGLFDPSALVELVGVAVIP